MGFLRGSVGNIEIESRRDGFIIHWGYNEDDPRYDVHDSFQRLWREQVDPEFGYEELDSLIKALVELKARDTRLKEWEQKQLQSVSQSR